MIQIGTSEQDCESFDLDWEFGAQITNQFDLDQNFGVGS